MKNVKLFVHVHIYYANLWDELKFYLKNITLPYDMTVTFVEQHPDIERDIAEFKPDAKILHVPNRGWDIAPFVAALQGVSLADYDYVIKLHTKRNLPRFFDKNDIPFCCYVNNRLLIYDEWRKELLSFLKKDNFLKCLDAFEMDRTLGMTGSFRIITGKNEKAHDVYLQARNILVKMGYPEQDFEFVAGTMFMARAELIQKFVQKISAVGQFDVTDRGDISGKAHIAERLFGGIVCCEGYTVKDVFNCPQKYGFPWREIFTFILKTLFQMHVSYSGHRTIKILKIPVYRKKVKF